MYQLIILSFLVGSIPFGVIISRTFFGFDIRSKGSGNIGSTNVYRVLGIKWGIVVQLLDILKGLVPTMILATYFSEGATLNLTQLKVLAGVSSVLGHIFSPFIGFKGGKGINTAVGMIIGVSPIDLGVCLVFFLLSIFTTGMISVGSLIGAVILPASLIFRHTLIEKVQGFTTMIIFFSAMSILIIYTHRSNIKRILSGSENKFEKLQLIKFSK